MSFFDQHPEFVSTVSDKEQDVLDALREKSERIDRVMAESLVGECGDCGALVEVIFGWCTPCHEKWMANAS